MTRVNKYWDDRDPGEIGMNGIGRGSITEEEAAVLQVVFKGLDRVLEVYQTSLQMCRCEAP